MHNNQRDGHMRQTINRGKVAYEPNSLGGGCPFQAGVGARRLRERTRSASTDPRCARAREKFFDHFSQATLFLHSQSEPEQDHIVEALRFELGKVERSPIRERMVGLLSRVDRGLAQAVAEGLGLEAAPRPVLPLNRSMPADADPARYEPRPARPVDRLSPALSMEQTVKDTVATRKIAVLAADGVDGNALAAMMTAARAAGAVPKLVAPRLGALTDTTGREWPVEQSLLTASSVLFDAVYVPGGRESVKALTAERDAVEFVTEAYRHCKAIAADGEGLELVQACRGVAPENGDAPDDPSLILEPNGGADGLPRRFLAAVARHRHWARARRNRLVAAHDADETRGRLAAL